MDIFNFISGALLKPDLIPNLLKLKEFLLKLNQDAELKQIIFEKYPDLEETIQNLLNILNIDLAEIK